MSEYALKYRNRRCAVALIMLLMSFLCVFAVQPFANDVNEIEYRSDGSSRKIIIR